MITKVATCKHPSLDIHIGGEAVRWKNEPLDAAGQCSDLFAYGFVLGARFPFQVVLEGNQKKTKKNNPFWVQVFIWNIPKHPSSHQWHWPALVRCVGQVTCLVENTVSKASLLIEHPTFDKSIFAACPDSCRSRGKVIQGDLDHFPVRREPSQATHSLFRP